MKLMHYLYSLLLVYSADFHKPIPNIRAYDYGRTQAAAVLDCVNRGAHDYTLL